MNIVPKLTLVFVVALLPVMAIGAWRRIDRDATRYVEDMKRDQRTVGRVLRANLIEMRRVEGTLEARHLRELANATDQSDSAPRFDYIRHKTLLESASSDPDFSAALRGEDV